MTRELESLALHIYIAIPDLASWGHVTILWSCCRPSRCLGNILHLLTNVLSCAVDTSAELVTGVATSWLQVLRPNSGGTHMAS